MALLKQAFAKPIQVYFIWSNNCAILKFFSESRPISFSSVLDVWPEFGPLNDYISDAGLSTAVIPYDAVGFTRDFLYSIQSEKKNKVNVAIGDEITKLKIANQAPEDFVIKYKWINNSLNRVFPSNVVSLGDGWFLQGYDIWCFEKLGKFDLRLLENDCVQYIDLLEFTRDTLPFLKNAGVPVESDIVYSPQSAVLINIESVSSDQVGFDINWHVDPTKVIWNDALSDYLISDGHLLSGINPNEIKKVFDNIIGLHTLRSNEIANFLDHYFFKWSRWISGKVEAFIREHNWYLPPYHWIIKVYSDVRNSIGSAKAVPYLIINKQMLSSEDFIFACKSPYIRLMSGWVRRDDLLHSANISISQKTVNGISLSPWPANPELVVAKGMKVFYDGFEGVISSGPCWPMNSGALNEDLKNYLDYLLYWGLSGGIKGGYGLFMTYGLQYFLLLATKQPDLSFAIIGSNDQYKQLMQLAEYIPLLKTKQFHLFSYDMATFTETNIPIVIYLEPDKVATPQKMKPSLFSCAWSSIRLGFFAYGGLLLGDDMTWVNLLLGYNANETISHYLIRDLSSDQYNYPPNYTYALTNRLTTEDFYLSKPIFATDHADDVSDVEKAENQLYESTSSVKRTDKIIADEAPENSSERSPLQNLSTGTGHTDAVAHQTHIKPVEEVLSDDGSDVSPIADVQMNDVLARTRWYLGPLFIDGYDNQLDFDSGKIEEQIWDMSLNLQQDKVWRDKAQDLYFLHLQALYTYRKSKPLMSLTIERLMMFVDNHNKEYQDRIYDLLGLEKPIQTDEVNLEKTNANEPIQEMPNVSFTEFFLDKLYNPMVDADLDLDDKQAEVVIARNYRRISWQNKALASDYYTDHMEALRYHQTHPDDKGPYVSKRLRNALQDSKSTDNKEDEVHHMMSSLTQQFLGKDFVPGVDDSLNFDDPSAKYQIQANIVDLRSKHVSTEKIVSYIVTHFDALRKYSKYKNEYSQFDTVAEHIPDGQKIVVEIDEKEDVTYGDVFIKPSGDQLSTVSEEEESNIVHIRDDLNDEETDTDELLEMSRWARYEREIAVQKGYESSERRLVIDQSRLAAARTVSQEVQQTLQKSVEDDLRTTVNPILDSKVHFTIPVSAAPSAQSDHAIHQEIMETIDSFYTNFDVADDEGSVSSIDISEKPVSQVAPNAPDLHVPPMPLTEKIAPAATSNVTIESAKSVKFSLDMSRLESIRSETEAIQNELLASEKQDSDDELMNSIIDTVEEKPVVAIDLQNLAGYDAEWRNFFSQVNIAALKAFADGTSSLKQYAKEIHDIPELIIDAINDCAQDTIGDLIIEEDHFYDDYADIIIGFIGKDAM